MILLALIKKEITQFFRNKTDVITMFVFPIALILVLGAALNGLMSADKQILKNKIVYYYIEDTKNNDDKNFNNIKDSLEKNTKVNFITQENKELAKRQVDNNEALAFIEVINSKYYFYRNNIKENTEQKIFRNIFEQQLRRNNLINNLPTMNLNEVKTIMQKENLTSIQDEKLNKDSLDSFTYYTFAELVLIILYISGITSISTYKETFLNTMSRLKMSKISYLSIVTSKIVLGLVIGTMQFAVIYIVSKYLLNVDWGENIKIIFVVLVPLIIFSSMLGVVCALIFNDQKTTYNFSNILIMIMGFLGGSYMPISLIKSVPITRILAQLTPTYWANISILSISCGVYTNYPYISILISLSLSIILAIIGFIAYKLKVGGHYA